MSQSFSFGNKVSIDTRSLMQGDAFFALSGEAVDGHHFVEAAFAKGASAAVVKSDYPLPERLKSKKIYWVEDPLEALFEHGKSHLSQMPAQKIALTGSSGKTTTKELIRCAVGACLGAEFVSANEGNLNNHIGVPLSALKVEPFHKAAILELGMNHFGEIARLTQLVSPHIGLITNIGSAHSGNLGGLDGVSKAKGELFENLDATAIALVNLDDLRCVREAEIKAKCKKITFGMSAAADLRLKSAQPLGADMLKLCFAYQGLEVEIELPMTGMHNASNATAALAVACALGLDFKGAALGLQNIKKVKGRLAKHNLANGAILIDDTYNANPESMAAGLEVLARLGEGRRRIAVLGEMGELGSEAFAMHRSIGELLVSKTDLLFTCGENAKGYIEGAIACGFDKTKITWAKNSQELSQIMTESVGATDVVFVKGSRSTRMELVVDRLLDPETERA